LVAAAKVKIEKLNGTNWITWELRMRKHLKGRKLWSVVKPEADETWHEASSQVASETQAEAVGRVSGGVDDAKGTTNVEKDEEAYDLILQALEDSQIRIIRKCETSRDVWKSLTEYYNETALSSKLFLKKQLNSMKLTAGESLADHLKEFDDVTARLEAAGCEL
jgi:hypothetical protein